jgi:hypothetical protein
MTKISNVKELTDQDFNDMTNLKNVISECPSCVNPNEMEKFTEFLVRSLKERGG